MSSDCHFCFFLGLSLILGPGRNPRQQHFLVVEAAGGEILPSSDSTPRFHIKSCGSRNHTSAKGSPAHRPRRPKRPRGREHRTRLLSPTGPLRRGRHSGETMLMLCEVEWLAQAFLRKASAWIADVPTPWTTFFPPHHSWAFVRRRICRAAPDLATAPFSPTAPHPRGKGEVTPQCACVQTLVKSGS